MLFLNDFPITWSHRPYFDLSPYQSGAWHIQGIDYSYRNLVSEVRDTNTSSVNPVTLVHPASFREQLIRETGLFQYPINDPLTLPDELRTERWRVRQESISTSENLKDFKRIVQHASKESLVVFGAAVELIALHATVFRDIAAVAHWREVAREKLDHLETIRGNFEFKRLTSVYHRAAVFAPLLRGERQTVIREMDICQSLAEELTRECKNETERIAAHENLTTVFESRTKEALWLGDIDLAEERSKKMVAMEPLYSRYRLQLGEILLKQNKFEEAASLKRKLPIFLKQLLH